MVHAHGTLGVVPEASLLEAIQAEIAEKAPEFNHWDVSRSLMGLSAMGVEPRVDVLRLLERRLVHIVEGMNLWTVTTTLRALANMRTCERAGDAVRSLVGRAVDEAALLDAAALSNVLWSLATMGIHPGEGGADVLLSRAGEVVSQQCKMQELAYIMWGAATLSGEEEIGEGAAIWRRAMEERLQGMGEEDLSPRQVIPLKKSPRNFLIF